MQQRRDTGRQLLINNLIWFAGSLALAFFVWVVATLDSDPVMERSFNGVPIRIEPDSGILVTDRSTSTATVRVSAPQSTINQLDQDDIQVVANLEQLGPGEHIVNLDATVSRRARTDTVPRRIIVDLEAAQEKLVPVEVVISEPLPRGFEIQGGSPVLESSQVLVNGPQSLVERVASAHLVLNLSQRRNPFSDELRLLPVDIEGSLVENVTVEPVSMLVTVPVQARSDVRQVSVTPNILADNLPAGYALSSIDYSPQVLLISGPPDALESAPGTLFTEPIDLTDRTSNFELAVTVQLPNDRLFIIGQQTINVAVGVTPLLSSRQFDRVPVETIGLGSGYEVAISPEEVTVLMSGPQIMLDALEADDVHAVIDLNGLSEGNHQLVPDVIASADQAALTNISVLPAEIDVTVTNINAAPGGSR